MTSLILPEHVANAMAKVPAQETPPVLNDAYVRAEERVLDPTKIPDTVVARLPQPTGWRLLILPHRGKNKIGSVYVPEEYIAAQSLATVVAYVLAVGPDAYADKNKYPGGPWCKRGDWVTIGRYAGARFRIEGGEVRIINDDEVIATIADPDDIKHV
jgi:co-chaperonin GroES (HSP10)